MSNQKTHWGYFRFSGRQALGTWPMSLKQWNQELATLPTDVVLWEQDCSSWANWPGWESIWTPNPPQWVNGKRHPIDVSAVCQRSSWSMAKCKDVNGNMALNHQDPVFNASFGPPSTSKTWVDNCLSSSHWGTNADHNNNDDGEDGHFWQAAWKVDPIPHYCQPRGAVYFWSPITKCRWINGVILCWAHTESGILQIIYRV